MTQTVTYQQMGPAARNQAHTLFAQTMAYVAVTADVGTPCIWAARYLADQRELSGHLRQQAQHAQPDQEPVRRRPRGQAERGPQCLALWHRNLVSVTQHRRAQLMKPGERQLHLRLHAHRARHPAPRIRRLPGQVLQQHGLPHARITAHHQHPALAVPDGLNQPVKHAALAMPAGQL